tara:strand:+ start:167 stop:556 length:390 start_codon:yes stop_codon:yes gene_type:complete
MIRWSKITINGVCLAPEINDGQVVDGMIDFEHSKIVMNDFVFFTVGGKNKIKKVLGLETDSFEIRDGSLLVNQYVRKLGRSGLLKLEGHNNKVPENCLLVGSNSSPDNFIEIVHYDNITRLIPKSEIMT